MSKLLGSSFKIMLPLWWWWWSSSSCSGRIRFDSCSLWILKMKLVPPLPLWYCTK